MKSNIAEDVVAYLLGEADAETAKRVEAGIEDDGSEVTKYFEAMRRKAAGKDPLPGDSAFTIRCDPLEDDESSSDPEEAILRSRPAVSTIRHFRHYLRRTAPWIGSLAACILIAFIASGGGEGAMVASATPIFRPERGGADSLSVEVHSNLPGYVAVVSLGPGRGPTVRPLLGGADIPIRPGVPAGIGPLPPDTASVVFAVTERPASESILAEVGGKPYSPDQSAELVALLESRLKALGYRRAAVGSRAVLAAPVGPAER